MPKIRIATLELTRTCNFRCKHCYIETVQFGGDLLSSSDWIMISDRLIGAGCQHFILTGGEALLSKSFQKVYEHLHGRGCEVEIFSNGSVLKPFHLELFSRLPPASVSITLYGDNSEQYRAVTGCNGPIHDVVMSNVATLKEMGIKVHLGTILCGGLDMSLSAKESAPEMNTYFMPALHGGDNLAHRLPPAEVLRQEIRNPQRDVRNRQAFSSTEKMMPDSKEYLQKCSGGHSSIFVGPSGRASICAVYREISHDLLADNVSMTEILKSLADVHQRFKEIYFGSQCGSCEHNKLCRNCPAYSLLETGQPDKNPYLCALNKARVEHYKS